jgi:ABC-2 type transport system ATP-binding protein
MGETPRSAAAPSPAVEIQGLTKSYKVGHIRQRPHPVLRGLDLRVERGEVFGFLGPNGAGKTTTLKVLMGLLRPDGGSATVLGEPAFEGRWKQRAGYLPEQPYFYDYLTAAEYVDFAGRLFGLPRGLRRERVAALLERVGLGRVADVSVRKFSKGMTQRVGIAQALVNDPELVFLDEPMSGLDPLGRRFVRDLILELKERGKTVFFSTHILSDAETLCDRVAVVRQGRVLDAGRLDEILRLDVAHMEVLVSGGATAEGWPAGVRARRVGERWRIEMAEGELVPVLGELQRRGARILSVQPVRQSLEDYFVEAVGETAEVAD